MRPLDADRVREWRHRRMLSQQEVADRAGTSLFTIQRIERGEGSVRPKTGRAVAAALGVSIEELFPKAQAPLWSDEPGVERRVSLAALTAWADYLGLMLERWRELETELRSLHARYLAGEEQANTDLQRVLLRTHEFLHGTWRVARSTDGKLFGDTTFDAGQLEASDREALRLIRTRAARLEELSEYFSHYLEWLEEAIEEHLVQRYMEKLEKFLEDVRTSEASTEEVR